MSENICSFKNVHTRSHTFCTLKRYLFVRSLESLKPALIKAN